MKNPARRPRGRPPKFHLVKQGLRNAIIQGRLAADEKLPSFFDVAEQFGVAGLTAKRAIDELVKEGWLVARNGVGTFVRIRKSAAQILLTVPRDAAHHSFFSSDILNEFYEANPRVRIIQSSEPDTDFLVADSYGLVVDRIREQRFVSLSKLLSRFGREPWKLPSAARRFAALGRELYALPMRLGLAALQCNTQFQRAEGVTLPDRYLPWDTFEEILRRCRKDRDRDGIVECFGAFSRLQFHEWLVPFWQRGGRLDDRAAFFRKEALSVLDDLCRMHHVDQTYPLEIVLGGENSSKSVLQRFRQGRIAMRWVGTYEMLRSLDFPTKVLLANFGPVRRQMATATLLGVHRDCEHPEIALQFLDFCHARFIRDNPEYPFALKEAERQILRDRPDWRDLLEEGLETSSEPLSEGIPERTWAIENEIYQWYRLMQDRKTTMANIEKHWEHWKRPPRRRRMEPSAPILPGDISRLGAPRPLRSSVSDDFDVVDEAEGVEL